MRIDMVMICTGNLQFPVAIPISHFRYPKIAYAYGEFRHRAYLRIPVVVISLVTFEPRRNSWSALYDGLCSLFLYVKLMPPPLLKRLDQLVSVLDRDQGTGKSTPCYSLSFPG